MERHTYTNDARLASLPPLRIVSRRTHEHVGACPFCGGDQRSDRFHVWMEPGNERYWCRNCDAKGPLKKLLGAEIRPQATPPRRPPARPAAQADTAHIAHYRQIYSVIAMWAHALLRDEANPEPLAYIRQRGISDDSVGHQMLGVTLRDPQAIPDLLDRECPMLLPYAEEAGVLIRNQAGELRAHPNLCGALLFPYLADGEVVDLRTRSFPGKGYRSLPGGYAERGALFPFGWDSLDGSDTVILTEGEFKALSVTQAYRAGRLSAPAMAHPGLSYLREEWAAQLRERGVQTIILAYDSGPRPARDGLLQLAPEETWSIRHGQRLAAAGLEVRVLRLPLAPGQPKADLDAFLLEHSPSQLQHLIDNAPRLRDYHLALPRSLLSASQLPLPQTYPTRRARPLRLATAPPAPPALRPPALSLEAARAQIATMVASHAQSGQGFLVLAHPPGAGKGHNTTAGLRTYLDANDTADLIVWSALRKEQLHDQSGLNLIPLHGRNPGNCRKFGEAQALSARGYSIRETLCQRRCPHLNYCGYLQQFDQAGHFFAPMPLLQATGWWRSASVVVLDEFDPARLTRIVSLTSADLAAMSRATRCPHAHAVLRWLSLALAEANDRRLGGALLLGELQALARAEGLDLAATLDTAATNLPAEEEQLLLPGFPQRASLAEYEALPPNYLATLIQRLAREWRSSLAGAPFTSRIELNSGRLSLFLRVEHLIAQLAAPEQPKIILDATVSAELLRAIFPDTPIQVERPPLAGAAQVIQVITRDWAKSTLRGDRRNRWHAEVAAQIRPGRPTLVVCTLECEDGLREALARAGHPDVAVAHYGALRGSNAYKGHDVILAQVYHPNLEAIVREGRALFADDPTPLDEEIITSERILEDAGGGRWAVQVPSFADARLAALQANRREAEMLQCALRGRTLDYPDSQITLLFSLPLPGLTPTIVRQGEASPKSNLGRQAATRDRIFATVERLLAKGQRCLDIWDIMREGEVSQNAVRKYWDDIATRFKLRRSRQFRRDRTPTGTYTSARQRLVLIRRGRAVPPKADPQPPKAEAQQLADDTQWLHPARNKYTVTRVICHSEGKRRCRYRHKIRLRSRSTGPPD